MVNNLSILGSTGSIGTQTLEVCRKMNLNVTALCAHSNIELLEIQAREFKPKLVVVFDEKKAKDLRIKLADTDISVLAGMDGIIEAVNDESDLVVNAIVGMVGLKPTIAAIKAKKNIAFANKETLVAGGEIVMNAAKENKVRLLPVDSEHSAVFQCLQAVPKERALKKIILTASGGPFFGKTKDDLKNVTLQQALNHPNWSMGAKITIDSATMMNKGLEIIEAKWLFDIEEENIDVLVHRESIIHSMIEFNDNAVLAQLGVPDMKIPIQYAITYPKRYESLSKELDFKNISKLTFYEPDYETFDCLSACKKALSRGGVIPAVANGANEAANLLFRQGKISFLNIGEVVSAAVEEFDFKPSKNLNDVFEADKAARDFVYNFYK